MELTFFSLTKVSLTSMLLFLYIVFQSFSPNLKYKIGKKKRVTIYEILLKKQYHVLVMAGVSKRWPMSPSGPPLGFVTVLLEQPHILSLAAFLLQWQRWVVIIEMILWPFTEKVRWSVRWAKRIKLNSEFYVWVVIVT